MQTRDYKRQVISTLIPGDIINTRGESAISKAIRFFTNSNINHTTIYLGNDLLMEANLDGVNIQSVYKYINDDDTEIYCCSPNVSPEIKFQLVKDAIPTWGCNTGYDVLGLFGIAFRFTVQRWWWRLAKFIHFYGPNHAAQPGKVWCSELAQRVYTNGFEFVPGQDPTWLTPDEVYNSINCTKKN
jgi:hypothetical protein